MKPRAPQLHLHDKKLQQLEKHAGEIRKDIIEMLVAAGSGHSAGPLGMADIFSALYFHVMVHDPKKPLWKDRDRLILSNGHIVPVRYAAMAEAGYFPKKELKSLRKFGSALQGHPERVRMPAIENTAGPLGDGSSQAVGLAYAALMDGAPWRTYCIMSDGELECGITWEAMLFASRNSLYNCTFIIDRNNIQIDGTTEDIMPLEPLADKFEAFGMNVITCAGNDIRDFVTAISRAHGCSDKPSVIIAQTIPGRGVEYMEYDYTWHGMPPKPGEQEKTALHQLRTLGGKITSEHQ